MLAPTVTLEQHLTCTHASDGHGLSTVPVCLLKHVRLAGEITATEALRDACQSLKEVCLHVKQTYKDANTEFDHNQSQDMQS